MRATWRSLLRAAKDEALLAVQAYNAPGQPRRLEAFYVHMHLAWHYLLHAKFRRDRIDYRYRTDDGKLERIGGEPREWDLERSIEEEWPSDHPIRRNLELSLALRNRIEHRSANLDAVVERTAGYSQAMLVNLETSIVDAFGAKESIADRLRFPVFVSSITVGRTGEPERPRKALPAGIDDLIAAFEADLDEGVTGDQRYELRIRLVPQLGPRAAADSAITFVREEDLTAEQREALATLGRTGTVIAHQELRAVVSHGLMKPGAAAAAIEARIPFKFGASSEFPRAWRALGVRPPAGGEHPERTDERYCTYDEPHRDYLYTQAFVDKVVRNCDTAARYRRFIGREPRAKVSTIGSTDVAAAPAPDRPASAAGA
jgi:hypothetical protein